MDYNTNRLYVVDYYNHAVRIIHIAPATGVGESTRMRIPVKIYPNPATRHVTISFETINYGINLKIMNTTGMVILQHSNLNQQAIQLDVSAWNKGVYFVEYQDVSNTPLSKPFIVL